MVFGEESPSLLTRVEHVTDHPDGSPEVGKYSNDYSVLTLYWIADVVGLAFSWLSAGSCVIVW